MKSSAECTFKITGWEEEILSERESGGALKRAHVAKSYQGPLEGQGVVEYLMLYQADGSARFLGYETVQGRLADKSGSFVFEHRGTFKDGTVDSEWSIVEGSGTEALSGIRGSVQFSAGHQEEYSITLVYEL